MQVRGKAYDVLGLHGKVSLPQSVNWSKTKAFTTIRSTGEGVSVNLAGREPDGIVDPADFREVARPGDGRVELVRRPEGRPQARRDGGVPLRPRLPRVARASELGATLAREMDAALWTAIGLVAATSIGTLFYVGTRFDVLAGRMDARFDAMSSRFEGRFDVVDARFDGMSSRSESRFDAMDARFDSLTGRIEARFDALDARMDALGSRLDAHLDRHAS